MRFEQWPFLLFSHKRAALHQEIHSQIEKKSTPKYWQAEGCNRFQFILNWSLSISLQDVKSLNLQAPTVSCNAYSRAARFVFLLQIPIPYLENSFLVYAMQKRNYWENMFSSETNSIWNLCIMIHQLKYKNRWFENNCKSKHRKIYIIK